MKCVRAVEFVATVSPRSKGSCRDDPFIARPAVGRRLGGQFCSQVALSRRVDLGAAYPEQKGRAS